MTPGQRHPTLILYVFKSIFMFCMSVCPFIRLSVNNSCYRICSGAIYHKDLIMVSVGHIVYICICNFNNDLVSACLVDTCSLYAYSLCVRLANQGMLTSHGPLVSLLVSMDVHCATLLFVSRCISSFVFKRYIHLYSIFATILSL